MVVFDGESGKATFLDAQGTAPIYYDENAFFKKDHEEKCGKFYYYYFFLRP